MYRGSCLCGKVMFQINSGIQHIVYCHCSQCRKAQGSAFATNGIVVAKDFVFESGESELTGFSLDGDQTKYFCRHCGSPIMSKRVSKPDEVRVRLGSIESDIKERPEAHIFVSSKANWETISGEIPQYDEYEPGR